MFESIQNKNKTWRILNAPEAFRKLSLDDVAMAVRAGQVCVFHFQLDKCALHAPSVQFKGRMKDYIRAYFLQFKNKTDSEDNIHH